MFITFVLIYCAIALLAASAYAKRSGYWNPVTIFGITGFYYYLGVPLEMHLKDQDIHTVLPMVFYMDSGIRTSIAIAALVALLGFIAGHQLSGFHRVTAALPDPKPEKTPRGLVLLIAAQLAMLWWVYGNTLFQEMSYHEANEMRYEDSFFSYVTRMLTYSIGLLSGVYAYQGRLLDWRGALATATIVGWGFFTSDKNPLLVAAMGFAAMWIGRRSRSPAFLALFCGGALAGTVLLPAFSAYRANVAVDWHTLVNDFTLEFQDANGPMMSLSSAMNGDEEPLYGSSYAYTLVCWVPRHIWPDRPYDLAQTFAHENIDAWRPGAGLGYSMLAEGYLNFGYPGIFLQYFAIAFLLNRLWMVILPWCVRCGALSLWASLTSVLYFQLLVTMHRGPVSSVAQSCLRELPVFVVAMLVFDRVQHGVRSRTPRFTQPIASPLPSPGSAGS